MKTNTRAVERNNQFSEAYAADLTFNQKEMVRYQAIREYLCCEVNGEAVVLSLKNGKYYGLNPVALRIWELIQTPLSANEVEKAILLEYKVENEVCEQAVATFLKQMAAEDLIILINEEAPELF